MTKCAELLNDSIDIDFIDINVGCPIDVVYSKVSVFRVHVFDLFEVLYFILTLQLDFLFSDWLSSKYAECIENVHCILHLDCARCFWCVIVTLTDPFFHLEKLLLFFMICGILMHFIRYFFHELDQMILFFCGVRISWVNLVARETLKIRCTCAYVDARPVHSPSVCAVNEH